MKYIFLAMFVFVILPIKANAEAFGEDIFIQIKPAFVTKDDLNRIASSGFAGVRFGIRWNQVERIKGRYSLNAPILVYKDGTTSLSFEELVSALHNRDLKMIIVIFGGNKYYTGPLKQYTPPKIMPLTRVAPRLLIPPPRTTDEIKSFAKFASDIVLHFTKKYDTSSFRWIIWNEPNLWSFYPPEPSPEIFSKLLYQSCTTIKQLVPKAIVGGSGFAPDPDTWWGTDLEFVTAMLETSNVLECLDLITFHPYRPVAPETVWEAYNKIRDTIEKWQPLSGHVPIAVDEWGYSSQRKYIASVSLGKQASFLARIYLINHLYGIPFTNLYEWKNSGNNPEEREHNFGLISNDGTAKPALTIISNLLLALKGYELERRVNPQNCSLNDYVLIFKKGDLKKAVAWSTSNSNKKLNIELKPNHTESFILNDENIHVITLNDGASMNCI